MKIYKVILVILSDLAKIDLQNIVSYINAVDSFTRAKHVERSILSEMKRLKRFSTAYPKDEYASTNETLIRFLVKWNYKILFSINVDTVLIAGIFHTAQNPDKLTYTAF